jgi:hypothetical protein
VTGVQTCALPICPTCATILASHYPQINFTHSTVYLGTLFALSNSPAEIYAAAVEKLEKRVNRYMPAKDAFPVWRRILVANVFLVSLFSYLYSIYLIPDATLNKIYGIIGRWVCPGKWKALIPSLLTHPRKHLGFEKPLDDIRLRNVAAIITSAPAPDPPPQPAPKNNPAKTCNATVHTRAAHTFLAKYTKDLDEVPADATSTYG